MDQAYIEKLAETAILNQELRKIAGAAQGFDASKLLPAVLGTGIGAIGGGLAGYLTKSDDPNVDARIRKAAIIGALLGLGGGTGYQKLDTMRRPGEHILTGVPDNVAARLAKVGIPLPRPSATPPAKPDYVPGSMAETDRAKTPADTNPDTLLTGVGNYAGKWLDQSKWQTAGRLGADAYAYKTGLRLGEAAHTERPDLATLRRALASPGTAQGSIEGTSMLGRSGTPETYAELLGLKKPEDIETFTENVAGWQKYYHDMRANDPSLLSRKGLRNPRLALRSKELSLDRAIRIGLQAVNQRKATGVKPIPPRVEFPVAGGVPMRSRSVMMPKPGGPAPDPLQARIDAVRAGGKPPPAPATPPSKPFTPQAGDDPATVTKAFMRQLGKNRGMRRFRPAADRAKLEMGERFWQRGLPGIATMAATDFGINRLMPPAGRTEASQRLRSWLESKGGLPVPVPSATREQEFVGK